MDADAPPLVRETLGDEEVVAAVDLRGEDALYVTPSRTLHYQSEGLLSEESVAEYPHGAERVAVSEGRRKATVTFDYGPDGERALTVPVEQADQALHPVLAGVLSAAGVTVPGETITRTYRFSELTLAVTSHRVVKHVGAAAWTTDYETVPYEAVRRLDVEEGDVAAQLVLETDRRIERIKVPTEAIRDVREQVRAALLAYHDAATYEEFRRAVGPADGDGEPADADGGANATVDAEDADPGGGRPDDARSAFESADLDPIDPDRDADDSVAADPGPPGVRDPQSGTADDSGAAEAEKTGGVESSAPDVQIDGDGGASAGVDAEAADGTGGGPDREGTPEGGADGRNDAGARDDAGAGVDANADARADDGRAGGSQSSSGPAVDAADLATRVEELEAVVDRQADLLEEQRDLLAELAELADALNRGRDR